MISPASSHNSSATFLVPAIMIGIVLVANLLSKLDFPTSFIHKNRRKKIVIYLNGGQLSESLKKLIILSHKSISLRDLKNRQDIQKRLDGALNTFTNHMTGEFGFTSGFYLRSGGKKNKNILFSSSYSVRDDQGFHQKWLDLDGFFSIRREKLRMVIYTREDLIVGNLIKTLDLYGVTISFPRRG